MFALFFRTKTAERQTALSLACSMRHGATAGVLLSYGACPSEVGEKYKTERDLRLDGFLDF